MSALGILTNVGSINSANNVAVHSRNMQQSMQRLSSGMRINSAADDAAGVAVATGLEATTRSLQQAQRNANDGVAMLQTAEAAYGNVADILVRMRELAVQSSNGTLQDEDREALDAEYQALIEEIERIGEVTEFNGINLTDAANTFTFQIGANSGDDIDVDVADLTAVAGGLGDIETQGAATGELQAIDDALEELAGDRAAIGAGINRLTWAADFLGEANANLSQALSQVRDVNVAEESARFTGSQVLLNAGVAMLSQSNQMPNLALRLIG